ncbi:MAG: LysR family transcriptional regulator [Gammaproteobacteria bacterium]
MKDLDDLRLFLAISEDGGFAAAARRLGLSPAAATRRIAALEASLATRLFTRSTRHVAPTQEGLLLAEHARAIVAAVDAAEEALGAGRTEPRGRLRVLARAGVGRHIVVPLLGAFRARYPAIDIALELTEQRVLDPTAHGCDVAVTIGHLDDSALVARRIFATDSLVCASPAYLARYGSPHTPQALSAHTCLTINAVEGAATWRFSRGREQCRVRIRAPLAINDADALLACAREGLGILLVADWFVHTALASGELVRILPEYQVEPRGTPITALYPSRSYLPLKARVFVDFLVEQCRARFEGGAPGCSGAG